MSRSPEQKIYDRLVSALKTHLGKGRWRIQRIETSTATGVHDCYFRSGQFSCWLETKTLNYGVSKEQYAFSHLEKMAGGQSWVVTVVDGRLTFLGFDSRMVDYSTLGGYLRNVECLRLSFEGWLKSVGLGG